MQIWRCYLGDWPPTKCGRNHKRPLRYYLAQGSRWSVASGIRAAQSSPWIRVAQRYLRWLSETNKIQGGQGGEVGV